MFSIINIFDEKQIFVFLPTGWKIVTGIVIALLVICLLWIVKLVWREQKIQMELRRRRRRDNTIYKGTTEELQLEELDNILVMDSRSSSVQ